MTGDERPLGLVVRFTVRAGSEAAFDALVAETAEGVREREPGTLIYACHTVPGHSRQRVFYELYRNQAAFDRHESSAHVRRFLAERAQLLDATQVDFLELTDGKTPPSYQLDAIIAGTRHRIRSISERMRLLAAILAALDNLDAVRAAVGPMKDPRAAEAAIMALLHVEQDAARSVLHMPLLQSSAWRQQQIREEYEFAAAEMTDLEAILAAPQRLQALVGTDRGAELARHDDRRWAALPADDPGPPKQ